ncbi:MAG: glycoside hydrolase family 38 C-terminal domain-containing protein [Bacteroidota bacterium]|nr:glycoside hydrolase family 38 C-terminal domain-containing protein [Bacteroidota bacterium]
MKKIFCTSFILLSVLSFCGYSAAVLKSSKKVKYLQGYSRAIIGGGFSYHSPNPSINDALLVRANKLLNKIEWESEIVPNDYKGKTISFIWLFAISRDNIDRKFHMKIGDKFSFDFKNDLGRKLGQWSIKGVNGSKLTFKATMADQNDDLMGIAIVELPAKEVEKGKPLRFTVEGEDAQSQEWYMTFQGEVKEKVDLYQTDCVSKEGNKEFQSIGLEVFHIGSKEKLAVSLDDGSILNDYLQEGNNRFNINIPRLFKDKDLKAKVKIGKDIVEKTIHIRPVKEMTVFILPHSHTDIGYTAIQTEIEEKQMQNLKKGIEFAKKTANYPEGSRFVWNVEVLWAADLYLKRMSEKDKEDFFDAVKKGYVALNGMYLNVLTGLCRPEELLRLFKYSTELENKCNTKIDAAMTSDIPGNTWGSVTAMAEAGIKYFSTAPNSFDRIGDILVKWENKPFYWSSPSGKEKVLVWIPYKGYALSHAMKGLNDSFISEYMNILANENYPYDISYIRWSGHGDNAVPEIEVSDFVKQWNSKYIWPRLVISSASNAFKSFENKYGDKLPVIKGDWTPYWEDGAGSSALETAMNRASSDRLTQAEALWAMLNPKDYPANEFDEAWKKVLLYSEHTWGAWCSVSDPESKMTKEQWDIKQSYALQADKQSHMLLQKSFDHLENNNSFIDVFNTASWTRSEIVVVSKELSSIGDKVTNLDGTPVASQRLSDGTLAVMIKDIPPFSSRRIKIEKGDAFSEGQVSVNGNIIDNGIVRVKVDKTNGTITELNYNGVDGNFADNKNGYGLNCFLYLPGEKLSDVKQDSNIKISIGEKGPLVASLIVESEAPSCNKLTREVKLTAGQDRIDIINTIDKKRAEISPIAGDGAFAQKGGKESLNFAFPFNVIDGKIKMDIPLGIMQPEKDQMPSACKNWLTVSRWVDVSNDNSGIIWATPDAPLLQIGELSANLTGSQTNPDVWRKTIKPSQSIFSWVMNNHWSTNYRAYQEGIVTFRYALKPHTEFSGAEASKLAISVSQPLIALQAKKQKTDLPLLKVGPEDLIVTSLKPSDDKRAVMISIFNCSDKKEKVQINWPNEGVKPKSIWLSNTSEEQLSPIADPEISPMDLLILRAELYN